MRWGRARFFAIVAEFKTHSCHDQDRAEGRVTIKTDFSTWPVVLTVAPAGTVSEEAFASYLDEYNREMANRAGAYVCIVDLRHGGGLSPKQRQRLATAMNG